MSKKEKEKKGGIVYQYLPEKYSKCPYCGSHVKNYSNYRRNNWEESIRFECGLVVYNKTPTTYEEVSMCKNTKPWKKLKAKRTKELDAIKTYANEKLTDNKLIKELNDKFSTIAYRIEDWW